MNIQKYKTYKIKGMDCPSCAMLIESELDDKGINCKCSYAKETLEISGEVVEEVVKIVSDLGYKIEE